MTSLALEDFTIELGNLISKRQTQGLSDDERVRYDEMNLTLRHHGGPAGSPEERRRFLRLEFTGEVLFRERVGDAGGDLSSAPLHRGKCYEFGIGGLFVQLGLPLEPGVVVIAETLSVDRHELRLDVPARVVRSGSAYHRQGMGLQFVDLDADILLRLKVAFEYLFDRAVRTPAVEIVAAGGHPAIAERQVLTDVICSLLSHAGLDDLWDEDGPTARARKLLSSNGHPLRVAKRVVLLFAWRLWTGVCDVRSTEFWHLEPDDQRAIMDLMIALEHDAGPHQWLRQYSVGGT